MALKRDMVAIFNTRNEGPLNLVAQVFEGTGAPPEFLVQAAASIFERSCGLPLFISQMAVHLRQARCSVPANRRFSTMYVWGPTDE